MYRLTSKKVFKSTINCVALTGITLALLFGGCGNNNPSSSEKPGTKELQFLTLLDGGIFKSTDTIKIDVLFDTTKVGFVGVQWKEHESNSSYEWITHAAEEDPLFTIEGNNKTVHYLWVPEKQLSGPVKNKKVMLQVYDKENATNVKYLPKPLVIN